MLTDLIARLRGLAQRRRIADEIDVELQDHLDRETEANIARGLPAPEARRRALADLGGLTQIREEVHSVRSGWIFALANAMPTRHLRRQPFYVASCVLTLTLAVAAATTMGAVIKPALLDPLPFGDGEALVMINTAADNGTRPVNVHTLMDLRAGAPPLAALAAARGTPMSLTTPDGVFPVNALTIEPAYFSTLSVTPAMGRFWDAVETNAVVLSWSFWRETLAGDPAALGRSLILDGVPRVVVGILPRQFVPPWNSLAEVFVPIDLAPVLADPYRARRQLVVVARLAPGATIEDLSAYLDVFSARMATEHPQVPGGQTLIASSMRDRMVGPSRSVLIGTAAATAVLLLIVVANLAGLAAVRVIGLRRQTAVKLALGASRTRIFVERVSEGALIAVAGSAAGVGVSSLLIATLQAYQAQFLPAFAPIALTPSLALAAMLTGIVVGTAAAAVPHLTMRQNADEDPLRASRGSAGDRASARLRMGLAAAQTALALVLVIGAGLLARTLVHLSTTPVGFDHARLTTFQVSLPGTRYARQSSQNQFEQDMLARLERIPGIETVTASIGVPINGGMGAGLYIEGRDGGGTPIHYMSVAPNFREVFDLPLLAGRNIDTSDTATSPRTLVINETMARQFWPEGNAIGARIFVGVAPSTNWMTVVGIVADVRQHGPAADVMPTAFGSTRQYSWPRRSFTFRAAEGRNIPATELRAAIRDLDPVLAVTGVSTFDELLTEQQARPRLVLFVLGSFAVVSAVLCALGLYGVLALTSSLRRREYAIRVALGSTAERVQWLVIRQALVLAATGVFSGIVIGWLATQTLQGLLNGVQPNDPLTFAAGAIVMMTVALLAAWLPARRAAAVDGAEVLSADSGG